MDSGASDVTGMALFRPSPRLLLFALVALAWELGPMLLARSINPEPDPEDEADEEDIPSNAAAASGEEAARPAATQDDLAAQWEHLTASVSDPTLAQVVARARSACAAAETVTFDNLALKTAFRVGAERLGIIYEGAAATNMAQPQYEAMVNADFEHLMTQINQERALIDDARAYRLEVGRDEILLLRRTHARDLARQIADLDADLAGLGAAPEDPRQAKVDAEEGGGEPRGDEPGLRRRPAGASGAREPSEPARVRTAPVFSKIETFQGRHVRFYPKGPERSDAVPQAGHQRGAAAPPECTAGAKHSSLPHCQPAGDEAMEVCRRQPISRSASAPKSTSGWRSSQETNHRAKRT